MTNLNLFVAGLILSDIEPEGANYKINADTMVNT